MSRGKDSKPGAELRELSFLLKETIRRARRAEGQLERLKASKRYRIGDALAAIAHPLDGARQVIRDGQRLLTNHEAEVPADTETLRILVSGHDMRFFEPIGDVLEGGGAEVRYDRWHSENEHDQLASQEALNWAQVVVAEWCLGNAVWLSERVRTDQRLLIRFHLRERASRFPDRVDWSKVDQLIFVGEHILEQACEHLSLPSGRAVFLPNLIEVERFALPKKDSARYTLGMLGLTPKRKRLDLTLDLFDELWRGDERWQLRIKGTPPEQLDWLWSRSDEREWYQEQYGRIRSAPWSGQVHFDPPGSDVPQWFQEIGFLAAPSDFESFHMAVGEALASGCIPLVWDWWGSDRLWPEDLLVSQVPQAVELVKRFQGEPHLDSYLAQIFDFVQDRYGPERVGRAWLDLLGLA